jgi:hypothetical protein
MVAMPTIRSASAKACSLSGEQGHVAGVADAQAAALQRLLGAFAHLAEGRDHGLVLGGCPGGRR